MDIASATHAALYLSGRPIRVAAVTDASAMSDMRSAVSMPIGCYSLRFLSGRDAEHAEDQVAGLRSAMGIIRTVDAQLRAM